MRRTFFDCRSVEDRVSGTSPMELLCDGCGEAVPVTRIQWHLGEDGVSRAWDHQVDSDGRCTRYSAMRNLRSAPFDTSARLANLLNTRGPSRRSIDFLSFAGISAYYVRDVRDLLWLSARVVAPAGFEPVITFSSSRPSASTLSSTAPLGVCHRDGVQPEYVYLRLGVGDWLVVVDGEEDEKTLARMSGAEFRKIVGESGVGDDEFRTLRTSVEAV